MATLIRNKLIITPNAHSEEEYDKQLNDVAKFCMCLEDGYTKNMSFTKIAPMPINLTPNTKEEDNWLLKNWGTRNKAINACWVMEDEMIFDTFWNPSVPIFIKIIEKFPNMDFIYKFASKRTGQKAGEIIASKGKIIHFNVFPNYSRKAYETAFELMPHLRALYTLNMTTHTYEYDTSDFKAQIDQNGFYKDQDGCVLIGCDDKNKPLFDTTNDLPF